MDTSNAPECVQTAATHRVHERLVVLLVLVGVAFGEVGDRLIEPILLPEVRGERDGITGSGVRAGQCPATELCVERERSGAMVSTTAEPFMSRS